MKKKNPITWVPTAYFAMGLPMIMLTLVASVFFEDLEIPKSQHTFWTGWIILPWSLKPIISIIMELFGTKRQYIFITELISAVAFGAIVFSLPLPNFFTMVLVFMGIIALSGSTHDIALDGMYMEQLDVATQSAYSGWQGAFYNIAKVLANGGLIFLAGWLVTEQGFSQVASWQVVMSICAAIFGIVGVYHFYMLPRDVKPKTTGDFSEKMNELGSIIVDFFRKKHIWYYLIFIFLYRFAEGFVMKIFPLFLKGKVAEGGLELSNEQVGFIYGTAGVIAFITGSILAGHYVSKVGLKKSLFILVCAYNIQFIVYLLLAYFQPTHLTTIALGVIGENFGYGFGAVGLTLFIMQQVAPGKNQMTHNAFGNSLAMLSLALSGMASGALSESLGYLGFFLLAIVLIIPSITLAWYVPFSHKNHTEV
ncbi:MFS transporter [Capnocytophaga sp.]